MVAGYWDGLSRVGKFLIAAGLFLTLASQAHADPLEGIVIAPELNVPPYDRDLYKHWIENDDPVDEDCQNVRHEVLVRESLAPPTFTNERECTVNTGYWYDPFTGKTFTLASDVDIDHFVPLKEAHVSGGHSWDAQKRQDYANYRVDPRHLIAVEDNANQAKSDQDPAEWMPPNEAYHCAYVLTWVAIKRNWGLTMDEAEANKMREVLASCPS